MSLWAVSGASLLIAFVVGWVGGLRKSSAFAGIYAWVAGASAVALASSLVMPLERAMGRNVYHFLASWDLAYGLLMRVLPGSFFLFVVLWLAYRLLPWRVRDRYIALGAIAGLGAATAIPVLEDTTFAEAMQRLVVLMVAGGVMGYGFARAREAVFRGTEFRWMATGFLMGFLVLAGLEGAQVLAFWAGSAYAGALLIGSMAAWMPGRRTEEEEGLERRILEAEDPVEAIIRTPMGPSQKAWFVQELLEREGIRGYSVTELLRASEGAITVKALETDSLKPVVLRLLSPAAVRPEGWQRFERVVEDLRERPVEGVLPCRALFEGGRCVVLVRALGFVSLREYVENSVGKEDLLGILEQVLRVLVRLWARGLVHGRLVPENVFLHEGEIFLADLGMALITEDRALHRAFLEETAEGAWTFRRDLSAFRALLRWVGEDLPEWERWGPLLEEERWEEVRALVPRLEHEEICERVLEKGRSLLRHGVDGAERGLVLAVRATGLDRRRGRELLAEANRALLESARRALERGETARSYRWLMRYVEMNPVEGAEAAAQMEQLVGEFVRRGDWFLFARGNREKALELYRGAMALSPGDPAVRGRLEMLFREPAVSVGPLFAVLVGLLVAGWGGIAYIRWMEARAPVVQQEKGLAEGVPRRAQYVRVAVYPVGGEGPWAAAKVGDWMVLARGNNAWFVEVGSLRPPLRIPLMGGAEEVRITGDAIRCSEIAWIPAGARVAGMEVYRVLGVSAERKDVVQALELEGPAVGMACVEGDLITVSTGGVVRWREGRPLWRWLEGDGLFAGGAAGRGVVFAVSGERAQKEEVPEEQPAEEEPAETKKPEWENLRLHLLSVVLGRAVRTGELDARAVRGGRGAEERVVLITEKGLEMWDPWRMAREWQVPGEWEEVYWDGKSLVARRGSLLVLLDPESGAPVEEAEGF